VKKNEKNKGCYKTNRKRTNAIKYWVKKDTGSKKLKGWGKFDKNVIKKKEPKIDVLTYELLAFTLIYNDSSLVIYQSFKSLFMNSSYVKFDRSLPLLLLQAHLITPL
jgi:hypothetical protein